MNGLSITDLRSRGTALRHQAGINTCARCLEHYFQTPNTHAVGSCSSDASSSSSASASAAPKAECFIHASELSPQAKDESQRVYPCCGRVAGTRGCTPAPHLPMFQTVGGQIQAARRIDYGENVDLHAGRWVSTRMPLSELSSKGDAAAPDAADVVLPTPVIRGPIPDSPASLGAPVPRTGDEIMVAGQLYHTGTPVILWGDVGGYDHYRVERRYVPFAEASWATTQEEVPTMTTPNRYGLRKNGLTDAQIEAVRGGQWDLPTLQKQVFQLVFHYDEVGTSRECFRVLQDTRDLSITFMCDLDGTIYQALDVKERALQATTANTNSVGTEIANIGAYDPSAPNPFTQWYGKNAAGQTIITIPPQFGDGGIHTPGFVGQPARPAPIAGNIQGMNLVQFDYTPQQYAALSKLIAAMCTIFPDIPPTYPVDANGQLITVKLPDATLATYKGLLGHYHIQTDKIDPGPAMQWNLLTEQAKIIMAAAQQAKAQQLAANAPSASSSAAAAPSELDLMRKMEKKLLRAADENAARSVTPADPFYIVEGSWWSGWKAWLSGSGPRPGPVSNLALLQADERTPRANLQFQRDYRVVHAKVWEELVDLYGAEVTIVRPTTDIYATSSAATSTSSSSAVSVPVKVAPTVPAVPKAAEPVGVPAPAAAAAPAAREADVPAATFVVPVIDTDADEPWILVSKRVTV